MNREAPIQGRLGLVVAGARARRLRSEASKWRRGALERVSGASGH